MKEAEQETAPVEESEGEEVRNQRRICRGRDSTPDLSRQSLVEMQA